MDEVHHALLRHLLADAGITNTQLPWGDIDTANLDVVSWPEYLRQYLICRTVEPTDDNPGTECDSTPTTAASSAECIACMRPTLKRRHTCSRGTSTRPIKEQRPVRNSEYSELSDNEGLREVAFRLCQAIC